MQIIRGTDLSSFSYLPACDYNTFKLQKISQEDKNGNAPLPDCAYTPCVKCKPGTTHACYFVNLSLFLSATVRSRIPGTANPSTGFLMLLGFEAHRPIQKSVSQIFFTPNPSQFTKPIILRFSPQTTYPHHGGTPRNPPV
jgi:hypothetical protein